MTGVQTCALPISADGREATLSVDGYVYSPETRVWTSVATPVDKEGKSISLGGGAAVPWGEEAILCIGGVNKDIFLKALQGIYSGKEYLSHPAEWYQFNKNLLLYYPAKDEWSSLGEYEQGARAGVYRQRQIQGDRKSTRLNSSHTDSSRMPSSA